MLLERALSSSGAGQLLARAHAVRQIMRLGFTVPLDDVTCEVFRVLEIMDAEEKRFEKQQADEQEKKWRATR